MGSPIATSDPNATSRITAAAATPASSPRPLSGSSNAKNRSPPASIRRTRPGPPARAASPPRSAGRGRRRPAPRSPGTAGGRSRPPSRTPGIGGRPPGGGRRPPRGPRQGGPRVATRRGGVVARRHHHLGGQAGRVGPGGRRAARWRAGNRCRTAKQSSSSRPKTAAAEITSAATTSHAATATRGRRAAKRPSDARMRDMRALWEAGIDCAPMSPPGRAAHRTSGSIAPGRTGDPHAALLADSAAPPVVLRWGRARLPAIVLGRAPRPRPAGTDVARLGARGRPRDGGGSRRDPPRGSGVACSRSSSSRWRSRCCGGARTRCSWSRSASAATPSASS